MTRERWERLKPLFYGALDQPPGAREQWLLSACPADASLRAEALALLQAHDSAGAFLDLPARVDPGDIAGDVDPPLEAGRQIGHYAVRGELGRGGMGIVYLADDTRLDRSVALKALPPVFAADPQRRERLRREARAAAALTHPGIAIVYALEEIDGHLFIASEHVRGQTLRAEMDAGPLGPVRAADTAIAIARALCAAHEAGVVHRDLKPENVLRTPDGQVKVLDFGIARIADEATRLTMTGAVFGTPAYMAPEQLAGGDVDGRADVYALGILLVEMATGVHPFATSPRPLPPALQAVADRCLARDPRHRFPSSRDLLAALERAREDLDSTRPAPTHGHDRALWWWQFHQLAAVLVYSTMVVPAWQARRLIGGVAGRTFFLLLLAGVIVSGILRLHFWFTSRVYPSELAWVRHRFGRWVTAADWVFSLGLIGGGLLVGDLGSALSTVLLAVGIGNVVAFGVVEKATRQAAFSARR